MTLTRAEFWKRHAEPDCDRFALHHEYYIQFATEATRQAVLRHIGRDAILLSTDPQYFNDIPLRRWDQLEPAMKLTANKTALGEAEPCAKPHRFMWSLGTAVCIAKAVARQIRTEATEAEIAEARARRAAKQED